LRVLPYLWRLPVEFNDRPPGELLCSDLGPPTQWKGKPLTEEGREIWRSPEGVSLFDKILTGEPLTETDRVTLGRLKRLRAAPEAPKQSAERRTPIGQDPTDCAQRQVDPDVL
jgi:hypothetical protein